MTHADINTEMSARLEDVLPLDDRRRGTPLRLRCFLFLLQSRFVSYPIANHSLDPLTGQN